MTALTESGALAVVTRGGHAAQSANPTDIAAVAGTGIETERGRGRGKGTGTGTGNGHQKTKVRSVFLYYSSCFMQNE